MLGTALAALLLCAFIGKYVYDRESKLAANELHRDAQRLEIFLQDGLEQTRSLMEEAGLHIVSKVKTEEDLRHLFDFLTGANPSSEIFAGAPVFLNHLFPWEYMMWFDNEVGDIMETSNVDGALFPAEALSDLVAHSAAEPYKLHVGNVLFGATGNEWTMPVALAVADARGRPRGTLIVGIGVDGVAGLLESELHNPDTRFMLLDDEGFIVAQFKDRALEPFSGPIVREIVRDEKAAPQGGLNAHVTGDPFPAVRYVKTERFPFTVVTGYDAANVAARVFAPLRRAVSGILVALAVILTLMATFRRRVVYPLTVLAEAASEISSGRAPKYYPAGECREIDALTRQIRLVSDYNRELRESREELRQSYELTRSALRYMAREVRAPLAQITAFSEILHHGLYGPLNARQKEHVTVIRRSALMQNGLISAFLEQIREHEQGPTALAKAPCDMKEVAEKYFDVFALAASDKKIHMSVKADDDAPLADADPEKLGNVVWSLISNAVKYNKDGGKIAVRVSRSRDGKFVKFACEDGGVGIEKDKLRDIFSPFARVRNSDVENIDGAGLGLSYVKKIVSQHGGHITVKSAPGEGARFTCYFPAFTGAENAPDFPKPLPTILPKPPANDVLANGAAREEKIA